VATGGTVLYQQLRILVSGWSPCGRPTIGLRRWQWLADGFCLLSSPTAKGVIGCNYNYGDPLAKLHGVLITLFLCKATIKNSPLPSTLSSSLLRQHVGYLGPTTQSWSNKSRCISSEIRPMMSMPDCVIFCLSRAILS
jgi:hypothetical protein